jgi:hypothetical protein
LSAGNDRITATELTCLPAESFSYVPVEIIKKQQGEAPSPDFSLLKIQIRLMRSGEFRQVDLELELQPDAERRRRLEDNTLTEEWVKDIRYTIHIAADLF